MANTPDDRFYSPETLWRAFGISSAIMLLFTLWMVLDDFGREWKGYQREFLALKKKKVEAALETAKTQVDVTKVGEAQKKLDAALEGLKSRAQDEKRLNKELELLKTKEKNLTIRFQNEKAKWDVGKYEYEAKYGHKFAEGRGAEVGPKGQKAFDDLNKYLHLVGQYKNDANLASQSVEAKTLEKKTLMAGKEAAEKELKALRAEVVRLEKAVDAASFGVTDIIRSSPIIDLADPAFKLQQILPPSIRDDIFFAQAQKVDRCTTCHLAIDTPGFEDEAQPFRTHPKLDLILGSRSPHPIDKVGCTVCHEGRGQASHFVRTAHTPRNKQQQQEWEKKYHWHSMHHVIEKMVPLQYTEGKCRVCHKGTEYIPKAEKLNTSLQLIRAAGCYGCHRIEGWDHVRKPAPSLKKVKGKLSRDWIVKWVRNPRFFNPMARMPASFFQANIKSDEHKLFQEAEVQAITDYLLSLSEDYDAPSAGSVGSEERGKELVGSIGCLGCHQVDDFGQTRGRWTMAPDLSTVGSKVNKSWLFSWVKNPRHYWAETTMPSLRLSDSEAADITAYLLSKKNPEFEQAEAGMADLEVQKKVLRLYLLRDPKLAPVTEERVAQVIDGLKPHEVSLKLGQNGVIRYGCFGCHEVKGFEKTQGIGTELTEEGSKPVNKLDFGLLHLEHTNYAWFDKKLESTRAFDEGLVKEYLDLLRMPNYEFALPDRESLILALTGMTSQKIESPASKVLKAKESYAEEAMRVVHRYNCQGCHNVEQLHVPMPDGHPQWEEHEKTKNNLEGRILVHYAEDETLGPPPLVTQGSRAVTSWLHKFLHDPSTKLRHALKVRMPTFQFSNGEVNRLVTGWAAQGNAEFPVVQRTYTIQGERLAAAKALVQKLQCLNCHTMGEQLTAEAMEGGSKGLAPDFLLAGQRLHRDWIVELLKDPQKMIPGTRMPGFWPDGVSPAPELLDGNSQAQMEAVADYLISLGSRGTPQAD